MPHFAHTGMNRPRPAQDFRAQSAQPPEHSLPAERVKQLRPHEDQAPPHANRPLDRLRERQADSIDGILGELAAKGTINIRRAYGNWKNQASWEAKLHPFAIQPIQQFAYTKGKNALDMCMAIDAMDLMYTEKVDCFALVTSDSDFTPLVLKLLFKGKTVIGFGESKTPEPFVRQAKTVKSIPAQPAQS